VDMQTALQRLSSLSQKYNFPLDGLKRWFEDIKEVHKRKGVSDEATLNELAINTIIARLRKLIVFGGGVELEVLFFGYSRVFDRYANMREKALEAYSRDPNEAVMARVVDAEGNPIFPPGHPREGEVIPSPPESLSRIFFGLAKRKIDKGHTDVKPFFLTVRGQKANEKVELFKPYKITARMLSTTPNSPFLNLTAGDNFTILRLEDKEVDIRKFYKNLPNYIPLKEVFNWHEKNKDSFGVWFITEIDVEGIANPSTTSSNYIILVDDWKDPPEQILRVIVLRDVYKPEVYGKGSRLILVGSTNEFPNPDGTTEVVIMGYGVYPLIVVSPPKGDVENVEKVAETTPPNPPKEGENVEAKWE